MLLDCPLDQERLGRYTGIERIFKCDYDVEDVFNNFDNAIVSRVDFVERNEPRSSYLNVIF